MASSAPLQGKHSLRSSWGSPLQSMDTGPLDGSYQKDCSTSSSPTLEASPPLNLRLPSPSSRCHFQESHHEPETSCAPSPSPLRLSWTPEAPVLPASGILESAFYRKQSRRFCYKCLAKEVSSCLLAWSLSPPRGTQWRGLGNIFVLFCLLRHQLQRLAAPNKPERPNNTEKGQKMKLSLVLQPQNTGKGLHGKPWRGQVSAEVKDLYRSESFSRVRVCKTRNQGN